MCSYLCGAIVPRGMGGIWTYPSGVLRYIRPGQSTVAHYGERVNGLVIQGFWSYSFTIILGLAYRSVFHSCTYVSVNIPLSTRVPTRMYLCRRPLGRTRVLVTHSR